MRVSALPTLAPAIIRALKGDASLAALVGVRVYQGRAPTSVLSGTASYITIITPSENADNTFGRGGTLNAEQVHVWAASDQQVRVAAGHIMRVLANDPLYIGGGFDVVARDINLVTILRDPDNGMSHGVLRFLARLSQWADWPGVWEPTSDTVLFAEAFDQTPGVQTVRARIGPNGWLGDSPTTATNDPTLGTNPKRWVMGEVSGSGLAFGDVLGDDLDDDDGFTVAVAFEIATIASQMILWQKYDVDALIEGPFLHMIAVSGAYRTQVQVYYESGTADSDFCTATQPAISTVGWHTVGYTFDRTLPRATRHKMWVDGVPFTSTTITVNGTGGDALSVATPGAMLRFAGPFGFRISPQSGGAMVVACGCADDEWHAGFHAHAQARGWL